MLTYQNALSEARQIVDDLERITKAYEQLLQTEDGIALTDRVDILKSSPFESARSKMNSRLINVVVCGAFSSGKSFLISGLIGRLRWYRREQAGFFDSDDEVDGYSSFLPSSPEQTSSCPLSVSPNEISDTESRLEVLFSDSEQWEDKTSPYVSEDDVQRKMLTYVTSIEEWNEARPHRDLPRTVLSAKLFVPCMSLPAAIHDLPGIGGAGAGYLNVVHEAIRQADCIVYVASAIRELGEDELELLRFVEGVVRVNQCPVFFVLSQIDRERDWNKVLQKNNRFIEQYFIREGSPNRVFFGRGFFAISPAVQAKAVGRYEEGKIEANERDRAIKNSGMPSFSQMLHDHLTSVSGPAHLHEIVIQMRGLLSAVSSHMNGQLYTETVPLEEAQARIAEHRKLKQSLLSRRSELEDELRGLKATTLKEVFATSKPEDLDKQFKVELQHLIENSDVLKESVRHMIQQKRDEIVERWARRPGGLESSWLEAWSNYQKQTILFLHEHIVEAVKEASVESKTLIDGLPRERVEGSDDDGVEVTLGVVRDAWDLVVSAAGLGGGVAAAIAALGGTAAALGPLGFFLIFAGTVGLGFGAWRRRQERKRLREEMINSLPMWADRVVAETKAQAVQIFESYEGETFKIISRLITEQDEKQQVLEARLKSGDLTENRVKVEILKDYLGQLGGIKTRMGVFLDNIRLNAPNLVESSRT